jgi:hypothetical protein
MSGLLAAKVETARWQRADVVNFNRPRE